MKIEGLNFQPWIPKAYLEINGLYNKLLIMGESHYFDEEDEEEEKQIESRNLDEIEKQTPLSEFTSTIVDGYINQKWNFRFYRNLGLVFNENNPYELWENVAFSNGIQIPMSKANSQPTEEDINTFGPAFWILLEKLKPQKVLICSQRMWENWMQLTGIDDDRRSKSINELKVNGKFSTVWNFNYSGGSCNAIGINHPSSRGFSYKEWSPLIKEFLAME